MFTETARFTAAVNKAGTVNIQGPFEATALRVLRQIPGVTVTPSNAEAHRKPDATLRFSGSKARVAIEVKQRVNAATATQLVHQAKAYPRHPLLLIAGESTAEAREILKNGRVAVIDGLGNAHIELPGLFFHLEGNRRADRVPPSKPPTRLSGKAGVAAQALLLQPQRAWQVRDLATEAHISQGLAHRVLSRLEQEGVATAEGTGPNRVRRVTSPPALLDLFAEENLERRHRTLGYLLAQTPRLVIKQLGDNLERGGIAFAVTGAAAASLLAPFITALPVVDVWITANAAPVAIHEAAHTNPVTEGANVVFLQAKGDEPLSFSERVDGIWRANRFRIYTDLRRDPRRGREQASHFRQEVIGF